MIMVLRGSDVSCREVVELLSKNKINISSSYANKLKNKILAERAWRAKSQTYNNIIPEFEDELKESVKRLWAIAVSETSGTDEKIRAIKESMDLKFKYLDVLTISGKISKEPEKLEVYQKNNQEVKLAPEVIAAIECIEMQMGPRMKPVKYTGGPIEEKQKTPEAKVEPKPPQDPCSKGIDMEGKEAIKMTGGTLVFKKPLP